MEAPETAAHMAETSDIGDTHAVGETATSKMGGIYAAVSDFAERVLIQSSREGRKEAILWMSIKF
jgi:hypothetical protein